MATHALSGLRNNAVAAAQSHSLQPAGTSCWRLPPLPPQRSPHPCMELRSGSLCEEILRSRALQNTNACLNSEIPPTYICLPVADSAVPTVVDGRLFCCASSNLMNVYQAPPICTGHRTHSRQTTYVHAAVECLMPPCGNIISAQSTYCTFVSFVVITRPRNTGQHPSSM